MEIKIVIATDAWEPQVNGVVRTLLKTKEELEKSNINVEIIHPYLFKNIKFPFYKDIAISIPNKKDGKRIEEKLIEADYVHIATEGPLGLKIRNICNKNKYNFSTSYHTHFPEYLKKLYFIPKSITYKYMRWFHSSSSNIMVSTETMKNHLVKNGFKNNISIWPRGVDLNNFKPCSDNIFKDRPVLLYVGRVSKEKNIESFLNLNLDFDHYKIVVGDGPYRNKLQRKYKDVSFVGAKFGSDLAKYYSHSDLLVFPSKTDTFGLVIIESLACGTPVAAYPVMGPKDIITDEKLGSLNEDLKTAVINAMSSKDKDFCIEKAKKYEWSNCTNHFVYNLVKKTD